MITIEASALAGALKNAAMVVENANTIPVLANACVVASGGKMELSTCDLDIEYRQTIECKGDIEFTANARKLADIAAAVPGSSLISMELAETRLTIKCGRSRWTLPTLPTKDFPHIPCNDLCSPVVIANFAAAYRRVSWSMDIGNQAYPSLNGVRLHSDDGGKLAATNGKCMAVTPLGTKLDGVDVTMAPKFCKTLASLTDGEVSLEWDERKIVARIGQIVLIGKMIDGPFPDYKRAVPELIDDPVVIDTAALSGALKRVRLIEADKTRFVRLARNDGKLTVSAEAMGTGESSEEVPADCQEGHSTGLNGQFLASALDAIGGETIEFHQSPPVDGKDQFMVFRRVVDDGTFAVLGAMRS